MKKNAGENHLFDYLLLATAGVFFLLLFSLLKGNRIGQYIVMVFFSLVYVVWAIIHHAKHKTLHLKIVVEYIFIAALGILLLEIILLL